VLPRVPLGDCFAGVFFVVRELPGFRQRDQVLVAIQLPDDFVVSGLGEIEEVDLEPRRQRSAFSVDCIEVPIDFGAVIQVLVAQKPEVVAANLIGLFYQSVRFVRQVFAQETDAARQFVRRKQKLAWSTTLDALDLSFGLPSAAVESDIETFTDFLANTGAQFVPTHLG
jgi:hypothetical protein